MPSVGFHCSHEQIAPAQLLRDVQHAEQAGFTAAMSSDHLSPWSQRQGEHVNAAAHCQDPDSLWSFVRQLIRRYRQMPQIGWSDAEVLDHSVPSVLAHACSVDGWRLLAVHNLGADDAIVTLELGKVPEGSVLRDVLDGRDDQPLDPSGRVELRADGCTGQWLLVLARGEQAYA